VKYQRRCKRCENRFQREVRTQLVVRKSNLHPLPPPTPALTLQAGRELLVSFDPFRDYTPQEEAAMNAAARPTVKREQTVLAYLRESCRYDASGRKAMRAIFCQRWPGLYSELLHSEGVILMTTDQADAEERRLRQEVWA
jgi:hypothetical protein